MLGPVRPVFHKRCGRSRPAKHSFGLAFTHDRCSPWQVILTHLDELARRVGDNDEEPELAEGHALPGEEEAAFGKEKKQAESENGAGDDDPGIFVEVEGPVHAAVMPSWTRATPTGGK
jgi:hypothetical protein